MARPLTGKVVIATHNAGKLKEMRELLAPFGVEAVSAGELGLPVPAETGHMFAENAAIKAHTAARATGLPALSDDSGLCVHALDGAPGLFTADWAGPGKDFPTAMARVERELRKRRVGDDQRRAHFVSALVIAWPDGHEELFEGRVFGGWSGRRGATRASATIPCSSRTASPKLSVSCPPTRSTASTGRSRSRPASPTGHEPS